MSTHLPALTAPQAHVLAAYSYGMVMTGQCGQTLISDYLAVLESEDEANVRQRLREWCYDAADKCGAQRQQLLVAQCFAPLLRWVLDWWQSPQHGLVLVCDATTLRQTFTVLSISLVYRACALPVAWHIVPALTAGSWRAHWLDLLARLAEAIPADWQVLVLTDRGLYAKWLYLQVRSHGWHPLMRINWQGQVRLATQTTWQPLAQLMRRGGVPWAQRVQCFRTRRAQLDCTLLACWAANARHPWLLLTDLSPAQAHASWYRMRSWIEGGFKDFKRGGWRWEQTKMTCPARAERLWLVMAVATLWVLSVGGAADVRRFRPATASPPTRSLSCFTQGLNRIHVARDQHASLPFGSFIPDMDPSMLHLRNVPPKNLPL